MAKPRDYFTFYRSFYEQICSCSDENVRLEMFHAFLDYAFFRKEHVHVKGSYNELTRFFMMGAKPVLDKNWQRFENGNQPKTSKPQANGKRPTSKRKANPSIDKEEDKDIDKDKDIDGEREDEVFIPPSLDDIKVYYLSKHGHPVNEKIASKFINYYAARGWNMGRSMMTDWHAAFEQWCTREDEYNDKHIQDNESTQQTTKQCCGEHGQQREQRTDEDGRNGKGRSLDEEVW